MQKGLKECLGYMTKEKTEEKEMNTTTPQNLRKKMLLLKAYKRMCFEECSIVKKALWIPW